VDNLGKKILFLQLLFSQFRFSKNTFSQILIFTLENISRSFSTVAVSGLFVGSILILQFQSMLSRFDAQILLGGLNTSALIREVGPLLISFLLAGKIGAFTTAELAHLKVSSQIDALESLGGNTYLELITPRFFSMITASLFLLLVGIVISILGSFLLASFLYDINFYQFVFSIPRFIGGWSLFCGFFKCFVYSFIVATVSSYYGLTASGGAKGVGTAVNQTAIYTNLYIVIANFVATRFLELISNLLGGV